MSKQDERSTGGRPIQAVNTTFTIIKGLQELNTAGITELSEHLNISKSVVYNHLVTLQQNDFVVKEGKKYHLGLQFLNVGESIRKNKILYQVAKSKVNELADASGEYAHLIVPEHGWGYCLHRAQGKSSVATTSRIGKQNYLHQTASGKAILSQLSRERVEEIIEMHGLPGVTQHTITDRETLFDDLETIQTEQVAVSDEECIRGARAVGAPISDQDGNVLGAISISGPTTRLKGEYLYDELSELIIKTANYIEITLNTRESSL